MTKHKSTWKWIALLVSTVIGIMGFFTVFVAAVSNI